MGNLPLAPIRASAYADKYDELFYVILALTLFFTFIVGVLVIYFALRYRKGNKVDRSRPVHEHLPLEITWSVIPLILGVIIFGCGAKQFIDYKTPPKDADEVYVVGKQWMWHLQHGQNGIRENNMLHVPLNRAVRLTMISQDVIHAFYIPEFRLQYHVVPGRYTQAWFTPTRVGKYHLFCGMYCGNQHSEMGGYVYVMEPRDYAQWVANGGDDPKPQTLVQRGADKYIQMACAQCHGSVDSEHAPSLYGIYGKARKFTDGGSIVADDVYLRESILNPYAHITAGYSNTMPEYKGQITEEDVIALVAYIKSLGSATTKQVIESNRVQNTVGTGIKKSPSGPLAVGAIGSTVNSQTMPSSKPLAVGAIGSTESGN